MLTLFGSALLIFSPEKPRPEERTVGVVFFLKTRARKYLSFISVNYGQSGYINFISPPKICGNAGTGTRNRERNPKRNRRFFRIFDFCSASERNLKLHRNFKTFCPALSRHIIYHFISLLKFLSDLSVLFISILPVPAGNLRNSPYNSRYRPLKSWRRQSSCCAS